jgi:hypothetical protein
MCGSMASSSAPSPMLVRSTTPPMRHSVRAWSRIMEEKILLPAAQRWHGGTPLPLAAKLRLDHGALAALRTILAAHNTREEDPGGLYDTCEQWAGAEAEELLAQLHAAPTVPVAPYSDGPHVMPVVRRALTRAGYDLDLGG